MEKKSGYKQYHGTPSYRRFKMSLTCVISILFVYVFIEILYGALGYYLDVEFLTLMAQYMNIPLVIIIGLFTIMAIVQFKKFKTKVDDGTINQEPSFTGLSPGVIFSPRGMIPSMLSASSDATLSPVEKKVKGLIQMYPKITMTDLATKSGIPPNQIEDVLLKLISNGNIKGHVDPGTGEFISGMVDMTRVKPVDDAVFDCPHCGAVMNSAPVRGTSVKCESCGNLIVVN